MSASQTIRPCFPSLPTGCISRVQFSDDGNRFLTLGKHARIWDATSGQPVTPELKAGPGIRAASLSSDGKLLAVIDYWRPKDDKYGVKVWSVEEKPHLATKFEVQSPVFVQFDPYGGKLLVASETGACVWSLSESRPMFKEIALKDKLLCAEVSPLGDVFVTTCLMNDSSARLWDMDSGEPWAPPLAHESRVQCIAFNESGNFIVTGSADHTARVWDTLTGEPISGPLPHEGQVTHLSLSPDLDPLRIATITDGASSNDVLWKIFADGARREHLRCSVGRNLPCKKFGCVAFDQRGSRLAVANHHINESHGDGKSGACWWLIDANTFEPVAPAVKADWHVREITFSPDCRKVVVGCGWPYDGGPGSATVYEIGATP